MSYRKLYNLSNSIANSLLDIAAKMEKTYYTNNIKQIMDDNRIDPNIKYDIGSDIVDRYLYFKKKLFRYENSVKYCHDKYLKSGIDFNDKTKKMIDLQYSIINHLDEIDDYIKMFNNEKYRNNNIENNKIVELEDEEYLQMFEELLEDLENFRNHQLDLYLSENFYISKIYFNKYDDYENIFEMILDRYIERIRWIEMEIIKIKYSKYIGIEYSPSVAKKNIYDTILKYHKIDQDGINNSIVFNNKIY